MAWSPALSQRAAEGLASATAQLANTAAVNRAQRRAAQAATGWPGAQPVGTAMDQACYVVRNGAMDDGFYGGPHAVPAAVPLSLGPLPTKAATDPPSASAPGRQRR